MSNAVPNFFCEFCGAKVDKWAIKCDKCHSVFDSIKCPKCSFVGKADNFPNGCPQCGFQSTSLSELIDSIMSAQGGKGASSLDFDKKRQKKGAKTSKRKKQLHYYDNLLPGWAYGVIISFLIFVIGGMAFFLIKILNG